MNFSHEQQDHQLPQTNPEYPTHKQAMAVVVISILFIHITGFIATLSGIPTKWLFFLESLLIVPAILFVKMRGYSYKNVFRLNPVPWHIIVYSIVIGLGVTILADELDRLVMIIFPWPEGVLDQIMEQFKIQSTGDFIIIFSTTVLMAAILEELLFRGLVQVSFENTFDVTRAIMLTALVFAIFHLIPWWTIQYIFIGIFLGVIAWKTDSIYPAMIVHGINNGAALVFNNLSEETTSWYLIGNHVSPVVLLVGVAASFYGFRKLYENYEETHASDSDNHINTDY